MAIKPWDQYVSEAHRPDITLPLPDGDYPVSFPTGDQLDKFNKLRWTDEIEAAKALFGARLGNKLIALAKKAPAGTLGVMLYDVLVEWGLAAPLPEAESPNSDTSSD